MQCGVEPLHVPHVRGVPQLSFVVPHVFIPHIWVFVLVSEHVHAPLLQ